MTTETKIFTPAEANKTLPLVRHIIKDVLNTAREMRLLAEDIDEHIQDDPQIKKMVAQVNSFLNELEELGCFYKDWNFTIGLVDFPSVINGQEVLLCWRSDEDSVSYYHDYESGYSGRKPIPEEYLVDS